MLASPGDCKHLLIDLGLSACQQLLFQLRGPVKVILHRGFAPAGDNENVLNAAFHCLLYYILDGRLVHDGKHLLRHGLGGGKYAGSQASGRDDGFFDFHGMQQLLLII